MTGDELTQMPTPGLDDITPESAEREIRGAIYRTRELVKRAASVESREMAERGLATLIAYAESQGIHVE